MTNSFNQNLQDIAGVRNRLNNTIRQHSPVCTLEDAAAVLAPAKKVLSIETQIEVNDLIVLVNGVEFVRVKNA